ncbi:MAG: mannose-1-phosphate guanyltransferase [Erysipelotrichaceae bacterium]|nr:mannose-1-phosphate guanyltransferase [Erysipelotrichaceae bacterium]
MKAVILSGGLGTRLRPFTNAIPKPLLPIGEKAVLEIQIERLAGYGFKEIYLATNYKADYIEKFFGDGSRYGVNLFVSREDKPLGTAGPIKLLEDKLDEPFVVMNGDILSLIDFNKMYDFALKSDALFTAGIKKIIMPFAFGNIFFDGDYITKIEEKPDIVKYALAGIYVLKPEVLKFIPDNQYFGIDVLLQDLMKADKKIAKYEIEEYWLDIGRADDFEKAQEDYEIFQQ